MTGQEIKEMMARQEMSLENLSIPALKCLFDCESDAVCRGESDGELLCRVADLLAEKEGFADEHDKAFAAMLDNAMQSVLPAVQPKKRPFRLKKAMLVAAAAAVLLCCVSVGVAALGFDVFGCFRNLVFSPVGAKMEESGITLVHLGETAQYSSMEELLAAEELDIMYPTKFPEGVFITEIGVFAGVHGGETIGIKTNDPQTTISIDLGASDTGGSFADCEEILIGEKTFFIRKDMFFAVSYYKENYYYIQTTNYENLLFIIQNLKE